MTIQNPMMALIMLNIFQLVVIVSLLQVIRLWKRLYGETARIVYELKGELAKKAEVMEGK